MTRTKKNLESRIWGKKILRLDRKNEEVMYSGDDDTGEVR